MEVREYVVELAVNVQCTANEPYQAWQYAITQLASQLESEPAMRLAEVAYRPSAVHETLTSRVARKEIQVVDE